MLIDVTYKLFNVKDKIKKRALAGLYFANAKLLEDAVWERPRPPTMTGTLRGSGQVILPYLNENGELSSGVIFPTDYAARWHENPFTPRKDKSNVGNKYLEIKAIKNRVKYFRIFHRFIKDYDV